MEPALEWREHLGYGVQTAIWTRAAMEPALEWREHVQGLTNGTTPDIVPQWSPPWNGGNTIVPTEEPCRSWPPQWSPPWNGGNTPPRPCQLAEHGEPQWSPPWNGGNTVRHRRRPGRRRLCRNGARLGMAGTPGWRKPKRSFSNGPQWSPPWNGGNTSHGRGREASAEWPEPGFRPPQWSPPWNGGNTPGLTHRPRRSQVPQWSPPWNGGNTGRDALGAGVRLSKPQWSPPWNGGNTCLYAWSPACDRRRNGARLGMAGTPAVPHRACLRRAAMEPALEWREHPMTCTSTSQASAPQWSPPWNGGNTSARAVGDLAREPPQWSPPWNGGNTPAPARERRPPCRPQWSPPWNGGNTAPMPDLPRAVAEAAMEPALEWREHLER